MIVPPDVARFGTLSPGLRRRIDSHGRIRYGFDLRSTWLPGGRDRRWLPVGTSREEAERRLAELRAMIDRARRGLPVVVEAASLDSFSTVAEGFVETLRAGGCTPRAVEDYAYKLRRAAERFGKTPIAAVTPDDIRRFLYALLRSPENPGGLASATVRGYRTALHGCFQYAIRVRRLLRWNPVEAVEPPAPDDAHARRRASFYRLDPRDDARLLHALNPLAASAAALALYHGQRRRAVSLVRIAETDEEGADLDLLAGTIRFRGPTLKRRRRNRRPRADIVRPLSRFARPYVLRQYHAAQAAGSPWLHPSPEDPARPIDGDYLSRLFRESARRAGFAEAYFHGLAHIFTTRFKMSGLDDVEGRALREAAAARGHDSTGATRLYDHAEDRDLFALYRRFDEWLSERLTQDSPKAPPRNHLLHSPRVM